MSIEAVAPEQLAELLHQYHRALAPDFHSTDEGDAETWEQLPLQEKSRLIAAARLALLELATEQKDKRRYFAKPGEAEWGC